MAATWTKISQLHIQLYILADLLSSDKNIYIFFETQQLWCHAHVALIQGVTNVATPKYVQITPKYLSSWQPREPNHSAPYMDWWHDRTAYLGIEATWTDTYEISVCPFKAIILMTSSISIYGHEGDKDWQIQTSPNMGISVGVVMCPNCPRWRSVMRCWRHTIHGL